MCIRDRLVVSAPVQKGDVGDGLISLTEEDLNSLTGQEGTPLKTPLSTYVGQEGVDGDIKIQTRDNSNTNFYVFKRAMEQCENSNSFTDFMASASYDERDCANYEGKLYYLENDSGKNLSLIHISEPTRLGMISYAVFCLKKKKNQKS